MLQEKKLSSKINYDVLAGLNKPVITPGQMNPLGGVEGALMCDSLDSVTLNNVLKRPASTPLQDNLIDIDGVSIDLNLIDINGVSIDLNLIDIDGVSIGLNLIDIDGVSIGLNLIDIDRVSMGFNLIDIDGVG